MINQPSYFHTDWFKALLAEIAAKNVTAVALKMGVARSTLSIFIHGAGLYGTGKADPGNMEIRYRKAYEQLTCPHTQAMVGVAHCRDMALVSAPTHNPTKMMQWQACQQCPFKPEAIKAATAQKLKSVKTAEEPVQQAGIIDKVTLPLPEVGGPQIANQEAA